MNPYSVDPTKVLLDPKLLQPGEQAIRHPRMRQEWDAVLAPYRAEFALRHHARTRRLGVSGAQPHLVQEAGEALTRAHPVWMAWGWDVTLIDPTFEVLRTVWEPSHDDPISNPGRLIMYVNVRSTPCPCAHCAAKRREQLAKLDW